MRRTLVLLATMTLVVVASGSLALAASSLNNGSFETGNLSGWSEDTTYDGNARAVTSFEYWEKPYCKRNCGPDYMLPREGSSFALLTSAGQPPQVTSISQPFEASNGDKVSGWAFFQSYTDGFDLIDGAGDDNAQVVITNDSGTTVATPFEARVSRDSWRLLYPEWSYWEHTFTGLTGTGQFRIEARLQNPGPNCYLYIVLEDGCSVMGLDDVKTSIAGPDTTAPDTTITSGPNGPTNNTAPTFTFSGRDNVTIANLKYQYRLDSGGWSAASTSTTANLTGLSEGGHLFEVRAVDEAGNVDAAPAHSSFTVDTTKPMVKAQRRAGRSAWHEAPT